MPVLDLPDRPFPERQRLGVRVVDPERLHSLVDPVEEDVTNLVPDAGQGTAIELEVDDILVFLGRILGILDRAVRPPVEPFRMRLDPRMVWGCLDREVERDLEAM